MIRNQCSGDFGHDGTLQSACLHVCNGRRRESCTPYVNENHSHSLGSRCCAVGLLVCGSVAGDVMTERVLNLMLRSTGLDSRNLDRDWNGSLASVFPTLNPNGALKQTSIIIRNHFPPPTFGSKRPKKLPCSVGPVEAVEAVEAVEGSSSSLTDWRSWGGLVGGVQVLKRALSCPLN
ncbi:hypothetical protein K504DRAFT_467550 [Pleomassaria siparia CBS 279.74]|uniref:Uncharacterized protein n=1 Tax=Pleomassaria siparia CBS 279.74 TaxID=1314801 RepID=A0A6G1KAL7_9PLEO|nr:hypothetical protein K504DRAFT_467550 [Pleomassaria siparia CBS 279.74]